MDCSLSASHENSIKDAARGDESPSGSGRNQSTAKSAAIGIGKTARKRWGDFVIPKISKSFEEDEDTDPYEEDDDDDDMDQDDDP